MNPVDWIKKHKLWLGLALATIAGCSAGLHLWKAWSQRVHPKIGNMVESVYGIGTVTARHTYQLKLGVSDTLSRLFVDEGAPVGKGQPLIALADHHTVRAPFAGVVTSLPYKEGESVFPQVPVLTLTDLKNPYIVVTLEQSGAIPVHRGQKAFLSFESLRGQKIDGTVSAIYPKDGEFYVNIEAPGLPDGVLVGMTCDVAIQVASKENVLQVPLVAVDHGTVTLLKGGIPKKVPVKLGATDGQWAEVTDHSVQADDILLLPGK
ncbi:MAG TPA: efflux RND transporter periplasmic adaptor subunit [bacterium]|nr:efflux RND transporter periplasmic adaptor subunit [bacterium]